MKDVQVSRKVYVTRVKFYSEDGGDRKEKKTKMFYGSRGFATAEEVHSAISEEFGDFVMMDYFEYVDIFEIPLETFVSEAQQIRATKALNGGGEN